MMNPGKFTTDIAQPRKHTCIATNMEIVPSCTGLGNLLRYTDKITPAGSSEDIFRPRTWRITDILGISLESSWVSLKMRNGHTVSVYCVSREAAAHAYECIAKAM